MTPGAIRAFVALEMSDAVRERIRLEQQRLRAEMPRARWTRPDGQHLTLKFLGETPPEILDRFKGELAGRLAGLPAVTVRLGGAGFFPSPRRPRVAWIGGEADGGAAVAAAAQAAAAAVGLPPDGRPWSPHLTQARLDRPWPRSAVERFLEWGRGLAFEPFTCAEAVLFASELRPGGAVYTALERFPLQ
ncbi:MAG TPA: RNA 2',3'-cyclic phosphodiesterase [Methylomirabilota bacterium]|nr:RNA 2',3'-cyclic phosphodiesterase [Methylomirabilota bacterium]